MLSQDINSISAHKVLLAAYSPVFTAICEQSVQQNLTQQPFIHLVGISNVDLFHLLNFMYNGEADLPASEINSFLKAAKQLQVMGIADEQGFVVEDVLKYDDGYLQTCELLDSNYKPDDSEDQDSNIFAQPIVESEQENMTEQELICSESSAMDLQSSPVSSKCLIGSIKPLSISTDYIRPLARGTNYQYSLKLQQEIDSQLDGKAANSDSLNFDEPCFSELGNKKPNVKRNFTSVKKSTSLKISKTQEGWQCNTCNFSAKHKHTVKDHVCINPSLRKQSAPECIACHFCKKICKDKGKFRHHLRNCTKATKDDQHS